MAGQHALREIHEQKLNSLADTHAEKLNRIQTQFRERDVRTERSSKDSEVAVDAALQAAKEAVGEQNKSSALAIAKSEAATTKEIDQLGGLINTMTKTSGQYWDKPRTKEDANGKGEVK